MSKAQTAWKVIWERAARDPSGYEPFEVDEVVPGVARALDLDDKAAQKIIIGLMKELVRMPDGRQYFTLEGNAIVPLAEFRMSARDGSTADSAYPFET